MSRLGRPPLPEARAQREPTREDWQWAAEFYTLHGTASPALQGELIVVLHCGKDAEARKRLTEVWGGRIVTALGQGVGRFDWKARKPTSVRFLTGVLPLVLDMTRVRLETILRVTEEEERKILTEEEADLVMTQTALKEHAEAQRASGPAVPLIEFRVYAKEWDADHCWDVLGSSDTGQLVFGCADAQTCEEFLAEMTRRGALLLQQVENVVVLKRTDL